MVVANFSHLKIILKLAIGNILVCEKIYTATQQVDRKAFCYLY